MTLIIIPTYNESMNISHLLTAIWASVPEAHVLIVDDNSPDGTGKLVKNLQQTNNKLFLLERKSKNGLGTAYIAGFRWALDREYEKIIQMDADFSHDPKILPIMIEKLENNPVVIGSRYIQGGGTLHWSFARKCISKVGSFYARSILGLPIHDFTGGFNGWRRIVLNTVDLNAIKSQGYSFQIELKFRSACAHFPLLEIPIIFNERRSGQSKMSYKIILEAIRAVWRIRKESLKN